MKKSITLIIVALIIVVGIIFAMSNRNTPGQEKENKVGATIFPLYDITQQIAGDEFDVVPMLPPGASPHTFDPQPSLVKDLQGSRAIFAIGNGLDEWASTLAESVDASIVVVDTDVDLRETEGHEDHHEEGESHDDHDDHDEERGHDHEEDEMHDDHEEESDHGHDHEDANGHEDEHDHESEHEDAHSDDDHHGHHHGPIDPHYWLSVHNAEQIAMNIANELAELDDENASLYTERAEQYAEKLEALEVELQDKVAGLSSRNIIALHDAWYYFADEFGLNLVGTFEPSAGKEPTPQYLANLEEEVRAHEVSTLFMEPQLSTDSIQAFANDHNLNVAVIDPLGGVEGRENYIELMRYNVEQVVRALGN